MSNRDIQDHMERVYGVDVSPKLISRITDKILPLAKEWQNRPLNESCLIIFIDNVVFNVWHDSQAVKKAVYMVFVITVEV